jgi:hypothetical protein
MDVWMDCYCVPFIAIRVRCPATEAEPGLHSSTLLDDWQFAPSFRGDLEVEVSVADIINLGREIQEESAH